MADAFPLQWPTGRERTPSYARMYGNLKKMPAGRIRTLLADEMRKMDVTSYVISSNLQVRRDGLPYAGQREPDDPGVVLYFTRKGKDIAISCDKWEHLDSNLRAIGLTIEAIRGMERWGTEEMVDRAFTGFAALPESIIVPPAPNRPHRDWWVVLGVDKNADPRGVKQAYRRAQGVTHPDAGGSDADFQEVQRAYEEWKML